MSALDELRDSLPEYARDTKLNLQNVLQPSSLTPAQQWGVAVACAAAARNRALFDAVRAEALAATSEAVVEDGLAAASLMAMNNIYYRFRHIIGKPSYADRPARLRMQRIAKPSSNRVDFELFCLAVSAINGCEACMRSHEATVIAGGLTEDHVNDAMRIASTMHAAAVTLEMRG